MINTVMMGMTAPCKGVMMMISTVMMMMTAPCKVLMMLISTMVMVMTMSVIRMTADGHHNMHVLQLVREEAISRRK